MVNRHLNVQINIFVHNIRTYNISPFIVDSSGILRKQQGILKEVAISVMVVLYLFNKYEKSGDQRVARPSGEEGKSGWWGGGGTQRAFPSLLLSFPSSYPCAGRLLSFYTREQAKGSFRNETDKKERFHKRALNDCLP